MSMGLILFLGYFILLPGAYALYEHLTQSRARERRVRWKIERERRHAAEGEAYWAAIFRETGERRERTGGGFYGDGAPPPLDEAALAEHARRRFDEGR